MGPKLVQSKGGPWLPLGAAWYLCNPINAPQGQEMHSSGLTALEKCRL